MKISANTAMGRLLLALRAGGMTAAQLAERFGGNSGISQLVRAGLVTGDADGYRLTDAGRAACPLRNPLAARVPSAPTATLRRIDPAPTGEISMANKRTRIKQAAASVTVPQTREQAAEAIREIGERQRELCRLTADMNDELAAVKERWETAADPHKQRIDALTEGVRIWSEANRDTLTQGGKVKTAALTTGEVQWRLRPPSVRITGQEAVLDLLRRLGLTRFIRTKEEVNKEAILNEPEAVAHVAGIAISQGEDFAIVPFEAELAGEAA